MEVGCGRLRRHENIGLGSDGSEVEDTLLQLEDPFGFPPVLSVMTLVSDSDTVVNPYFRSLRWGPP